MTERVGALNDRYLGGGRPLGEARLLWEIGSGGCDVRELRARLGLDSGYLSRLLRSLEHARLIRLDPSAADRRVRTARLTAAGTRERSLLDSRSDELARSFLEPLGVAQRERLVAAMAEVERLLTAGLVEVSPVDPEEPVAAWCLAEYFAELAERFDEGFEEARSLSPAPEELRPPAGVFLLATLRSDAVGCATLRFHRGEPAIVKRMWVAKSVRGLGLGRRLLSELESRAAATGAPSIRLETNRTLKEAIRLYRSSGYEEIEPFNDEPYAHHWFEKRLA